HNPRLARQGVGHAGMVPGGGLRARQLSSEPFVVTIDANSSGGAVMPTTTETFSGFRPEAIQFLADLAANNDRAWFQPRKADYERLLKGPLEALCVALADRFAAS